MKSKILLLALIAATLSACDSRPQYVQQQPQYVQQQPQYVQQAPAPVIINQAPAHSGGDMLTGALLGGMAGHMIGSSSRQSAPIVQHKTVVVQKTVVNNYRRPSPSYSRPSSFGSFRSRRK